LNIKIRSILVLLLTIILLLTAYYYINWYEIFNSLKQVDLLSVIFSIFLICIAHYIWAIRWHGLIKSCNISISCIFRYTMIGCLANAIFPARPGGFIRMYLLMKGAKINLSSSFATILYERLFDILILSFISLAILIETDLVFLIKISLLLLIIFSLGTILIILFYKNEHLKYLKRIPLINFFSKKIIKILLKYLLFFIKALKLLQRRDILINCILLTILGWGFYSFGLYLLSLNFNLKSPPIAILLVVAFTNLASIIPLTPGSIGIFQFAAIVALSVWNVNVELAFAYALCAHGMIISIQIIFGVLSLLIENISLNKIIALK